MKIRLISDVHHEFYEDLNLYSNKGEDVLVIAGDLDVGHLKVWSALKRFADHVAHVVYVPGNHEYYNHSIAEFDEYIQRASQGTNIHFLNPGKVAVDEVTFIGACLWTGFGDDAAARMYCARNITDFRVIRGFNTQVCAQLYQTHVEYIKGQVAVVEGKCVVVTHFLPDRACISPRYRGESTINKYFASELGSWIEKLTSTTWMFGHTHDPVDITLGSTRVVANPYGYNYNKYYVEKLIVI